MSWRFKYSGEKFRILQCPLHNTLRDDVVAARLSYNHWEGHPGRESQTFIDFSLPFLPTQEIGQLLDTLVSQQGLDEIQKIRSVRDMKATNCWLSELTHKLHPCHYEKYKNELCIKKIAGTAYRTVEYGEVFAVVGRTLADPLKDNGWRHLSPVKMVVGKEDWYLRCELKDAPKWIDRVYANHAGKEIDNSLEKSTWWEAKDKVLLMLRKASK